MRRIGTLDGLFNGGDPATNTKGTVVTADWLNAIQEELAAVVEGLGGTLNPVDGNQVFDWLLASFANIGGNAAQTFRAALAAQFDSSSYVATTEFVKRQGLQFCSISTVAGTTALTAADAGKLISTAGSGGYTVTLPAASTLPAGAIVEFFSSTIGIVTVAAAGADTIYLNGGTSVTSIQLGQGDTISFSVNSAANWVANGGSAQIGKSAAFGNLLAASGYQKMPSGLFLQWGFLAKPTSTSPLAVTFPIAFPVACDNVIASYSGASNKTVPVSAAGFSTTGFSAYTSAGDANTNITFFAIGH